MAPERIYVFTASGTWRQQEERLEHLDVEEIKSSCKSSIMKPTRKARANMCKATLKKHSSLQVRCRSARTAQGGHRSSYWQLISERRGSGGRRQRGMGRGHGTSPSSPGARCWVGSSRGYMATGVSSCFLAIY